MRADYYYFAPTGGSYQSVFRGTLPRRYSIRRSQRGNNSATPSALFTTFEATQHPTYLSCVVTARRFSVICPFAKMITANSQTPCPPSTITAISYKQKFARGISLANFDLLCN